MQLTPKDIYEAARPHIVKHGFEDLEWEDFAPDAFYIEIAARLNEQFITPFAELMDKLHGEFKALRDMDRAIFDEQDKEIAAIKGLLEDYVEFTKYATPLLKNGRIEWESESANLAIRAQALLAAKEH